MWAGTRCLILVSDEKSDWKFWMPWNCEIQWGQSHAFSTQSYKSSYWNGSLFPFKVMIQTYSTVHPTRKDSTEPPTASSEGQAHCSRGLGSCCLTGEATVSKSFAVIQQLVLLQGGNKAQGKWEKPSRHMWVWLIWEQNAATSGRRVAENSLQWKTQSLTVNRSCVCYAVTPCKQQIRHQQKKVCYTMVWREKLTFMVDDPLHYACHVGDGGGLIQYWSPISAQIKVVK